MLAHRGEMHDDPVVFALKDRVSYVIGALALVVLWLATGEDFSPHAEWKERLNAWLHDTASALAYSLAEPHANPAHPELQSLLQ